MRPNVLGEALMSFPVSSSIPSARNRAVSAAGRTPPSMSSSTTISLQLGYGLRMARSAAAVRRSSGCEWWSTTTSGLPNGTPPNCAAPPTSTSTVGLSAALATHATAWPMRAATLRTLAEAPSGHTTVGDRPHDLRRSAMPRADPYESRSAFRWVTTLTSL